MFQTNSFEQFCINLANEKLQSHFTRHIFFMEQNEYAAEGINVAHVEFSDNEDCIAMIEGNPGVLRMMDEEVFVPKGSDNSLIEKLHKQFWPSDKQHHPKYGIIKKNKNIFIVHHYAGEVEYDITGFLDKNRDTLHDSLADAMKISKLEILSELFSDEEAANVAASPKSKSSRGKITLSGQFKKQLDSLMEILGSAQPHFVRCVKPNVEKIPNKFSSEMILRQMKYAGLFEAIRIRATGFAYRKPFINFFKVYGIILPKSSRLDIEKLKPEEMAKQGCKKLLEALKNDLNDNDIVMGKSKVFLRAAPLTILEMKRNEAISSYAIKGQARARGFLARRRYQKIKSAYDKVKVALERHDFAEMRDCLKYCEENMVQLRIVDELRSIMEFMKHQHRLWELLVNAIKERDINKLEGALSQFEKSDIAKQTKDERILKTIQDGKTLLNQLRNVLRAKQALKLAMQSGDATNLDHAIKDAVKSQLEDSILDQAKEILEQLNKVDKAMKDIVTYTKSLNLEELEKALKDVSKVPLSDDKKKKIDAAEKAILNYYENSITSAGTKNDDEAILHYLKALHESFVAPKSAKLLEKAKKKLDEIYKKKSPEGGQQPAYDESLFVAPKIIQPRRTVRASVFPSALNADMNGSPPPIGDEEDLPPMPDDFEEEELEEDRQERIARDERKILENLKSALRDLDREKMAKFLAKATDMGIGDCKEIIQARELCYGISELQFLDLKIQKALKKKQTVRLKSLLVEANKSGLDSLNFNLARQFISQKLEESRIKISKSGNIRDYSLTFNHYRDLHPFSSFRFLRKNEDFGKKGLFSKRKDPTMYVAVETPIRKSMIDLNLDNCKTKKRVKELNDLAILNFKDLLDFMKLRYHSFPSTLATEIIQRAINEPLMRDETFCQIIKQTSGNSNLQSVIYALKLLLLCLCNFRPLTKDMNEILKSHLASMASPQVTKFTTYDQIEDLAARCFEVMSKPVSSHSIPSQEEVQAFYDSISERLTVKVVLEYDESGKLKHARTEDINYRIPCVSQSIEKLMPYDDGVLTLDDLAINISSRMKLPFIGKIRLENAPAEVIPDGSGVLADTQSLVETLLQIKSAGRSKATDWYLVSEDSNDRPTDAEEEEFEYQINSVTSSNFDDFIPPIDEDLSYPPPPPDPYGFAVRVVYDEDADMDAKIQSSDDEEYDTPVNHLARGVIRKELTEEQKKAEEEEKRKREELEAEEKRKKAEEQRIREQQEIEARKQEMIKKNEENKKKLEQLNRLKEKAAALREQAASATESSNSEELTSEVPGTQESASPVGSSLGSQGTVKLKRPARRAPKPTD